MIAAILTGGASRRFGSDKALVMGASVRDAVRGAGFDPVVAVGGSAGPTLGLITVADRRPGAGPLAALGSVLLWAGPEPVLVLPCDLPLLRGEHLAPLVASFTDPSLASGHAVVAQVNMDVEHSLAIWPGGHGRVVWQAVERGERALRVALDLMPWRAVELDPAALADADSPDELVRHLDNGLRKPSTPEPPLA